MRISLKKRMVEKQKKKIYCEKLGKNTEIVTCLSRARLGECDVRTLQQCRNKKLKPLGVMKKWMVGWLWGCAKKEESKLCPECN